MYHEKEGKMKTEKKSTQLTTIVTDEVTVSSPVSGGFSVTGGASSEPALSIKKTLSVTTIHQSAAPE